MFEAEAWRYEVPKERCAEEPWPYNSPDVDAQRSPHPLCSDRATILLKLCALSARPHLEPHDLAIVGLQQRWIDRLPRLFEVDVNPVNRTLTLTIVDARLKTERFDLVGATL